MLFDEKKQTLKCNPTLGYNMLQPQHFIIAINPKKPNVVNAPSVKPGCLRESRRTATDHCGRRQCLGPGLSAGDDMTKVR